MPLPIPKTVYLDLDGVLVDFIGGAFDVFGFPDTDRAKLTHWGSLGDLAEAYELASPGRGNEYVWEHIDREGAAFWENLRTLPHGAVLLTHLLACNVDICFVSAPSRHAASAAGKVTWLKNNVSNEVYKHKPLHRKFALCPTKALLAAPTKLLIDDRQRNCTLFEKAGGQTVLWPQPWNQHSKQPGQRRTKRQALDEICDRLGIRRVGSSLT